MHRENYTDLHLRILDCLENETGYSEEPDIGHPEMDNTVELDTTVEPEVVRPQMGDVDEARVTQVGHGSPDEPSAKQPSSAERPSTISPAEDDEAVAKYRKVFGDKHGRPPDNT